jgi:hypothetical protein
MITINYKYTSKDSYIFVLKEKKKGSSEAQIQTNVCL